MSRGVLTHPILPPGPSVPPRDAVVPLSTAADAPKKTGPIILLVDDDAAVRNSVGRVLTSEGLHIVTARGAKDALEYIYGNTPDLVVTDLCMAPLTGWDLIKHLHDRHPALPIIVITALSPQTAGVAKRDTAAFFQKPLDLDALLAAIRRQFRTPSCGPAAISPA